MSHSKHTHIVCPNCGFSAGHNYCAQCGQETHLHKETFWGMVVHFVAHYFHYDSKFWQTLKTLLFKPGRLTIAYWEKKRNRYIPPISLYIFVSAVFFIVFFSVVATHDTLMSTAKAEFDTHKPIGQRMKDSIENARLQDLAKKMGVTADSSKKASARKVRSIETPEEFADFLNSMFHALPKAFFFMIPVMALILKLLYKRRKDHYFVNHAVFSLHVHALAFIVLIPYLFTFFESSIPWVNTITNVAQPLLGWTIFIYLVIALRNVYNSGWIKSVLYGGVIFVGYAFVMIILSIFYLVFVFIGHYS